MTRALRGDFARVNDFKRNLRALPITLATAVAKAAAPRMTELTREAFDGNRNVYGDARPAGADGQPLTLEATGETRRTLEFTQIGRLVRAALRTKYGRYLIGKYQILPNGALPVKWTQSLREVAAAEFKKVPL